VAGKDLHAQFFFQFDDRFRNARLRSVQGFGRFGQIQVAAHCLLHESELVEIHTGFILRQKFIMPQPVYAAPVNSARREPFDKLRTGLSKGFYSTAIAASRSSTRGSSPTGLCKSNTTPGWACRRFSSKRGRSSRACLPVPRNIGTMVARFVPA